jgi:hypothetical protein
VNFDDDFPRTGAGIEDFAVFEAAGLTVRNQLDGFHEEDRRT